MKAKQTIGKVCIGWAESFKELCLPTNPVGYSTVKQIAKKIGLSEVTIGRRLKNMVDAGEIEQMQGKNDKGNLVNFYKD